MDYHSMKRKELQSLCKKHHIPANMTNSAMADALSALNLVDEVEETVTERPVKPQIDLIDDSEPRIPVGGARSRRAPLREKSVEEILAKTSAPTACRKKIQGKVVSKAKENNKEEVKEEEVPVVNTMRSTKLHQESKLKISESSQEVEAKKIGVLSEELNVKDKGNNNEEEEKEVPVVNHVAKRSRRLQQKSKLDISESSQEVEAKKTDMLSEEVNVKDKGNNDEKEEEVVVVANPVTKRSRRLQQKSMLKTSESVQEVEAKKTDMLSEEVNVKDKGNNNGKEEEEVVVVNPVTKRSRRLQQKSKLKTSESVQEVEAKKTDILSEEVNGEEMKSESEVIDVVLQKNEGIDGNSSKEAQDNVASGSVDVVEKTMPESPETSRKPLSARKPQCDLVVNEPEIPVGLARSRRARLLGNSSASEEIIPKTAAPTACRKKTEGKLVSKAKGNNNEKEEEVPVVSHVAKRSTRLQMKSMLKVSESVLKAGETNEAKKAVLLAEKVNVRGDEVRV
ncbi:hypothetical protein C5167_021759 [Papaver somniferum]|uniref:Uncharacterized protein n=1 Tax=Papaver somniferum TaxID=3469 RepID=A0A4Y7JJ86_PAPSO|nr:pinin-like [Papaver somniferum]RZC60001.1 hypothetical protein C5167_021759 [Papaver somniferum]